MNCKQRRQELGSWQNATSQRKDPARDKWPLAKVKGIYCNKVCCFAGLVKTVGKIIGDNNLWKLQHLHLVKAPATQQTKQSNQRTA